MSATRLTRASASVAAASLLLLFCFASSTFGAGPAAVTVRVEGQTQTLLPPTQVTTSTAPVVKEEEGKPEGSCSGTSAIGALQLATGGNWSGPWNSGFNQYEIFTIEGEKHSFEAGSKANYYWSFWLDHAEASVGACEAELAQGDEVLFFPACYGEACPPSPTPLGIEAPADANVGEAVAVTVKQYNAKGEASPAAGADVAGGGVAANTDAQGHATLRFSGDGKYQLQAFGSSEGPAAVRAQTTICVHEGNDGTCGTTGPAESPLGASAPPSASAGVAGAAYKGPYAVVARATGAIDGRSYRHGDAPRELTGTVVAHAAVSSIGVELHRSYRGRYYVYDATRERFVRARWGAVRFFKVSGSGTSFSYLLPLQLPRGRYVFDVRATDALGNQAPLDRGSSRIVFYVR
jgi:hypothetical protein